MHKIYRQPVLIKVVAWGYIIVATPFIFFAAFWSFRSGQPDVPTLMTLTLFLGPFYIGAWGILWLFRGYYILTEEGIILKQGGHQTLLPYRAISAIEERDSQLIPYLLLISPEARMSISFKVEGFSDLYAHLQKRVPALSAAARGGSPFHLRLRYRFSSAGMGLLVYTIFTGALSLGATCGQPHTIWLGVGAWGLFVAIAVGGLLMNEMGTPYAITFAPTYIEARYLWGRTRTWSPDDLIKIEREEQVRHGRYGARMVVHSLVLTFAHGERLQIEEARIWSFGYSPDRLLAILTEHLGPPHPDKVHQPGR